MNATFSHQTLTRRTTLSLLAAVLLALLLWTAMVAVAPPPADWHDRALAYADSQHMFGALQKTGFSYASSFVSFWFSDAIARVQDYKVLGPGRNTQVFDTISPDVVSAGSSATNDTVFTYESSTMRLGIHSNPTAALVVEAGSLRLNVTFILSDGIGPRGDGSSLNLTKMYFEGRLFVTGVATLSRAGRVVVANLSSGSSVIFRAHSEAGEGVAGVEGQDSLANATVKSLLAMESFGVAFEGYVASSEVSYDSMTVQGHDLSAHEVHITIDGSFASPKLLALHLHSSILGIGRNSTIAVRFDGEDVTRLTALDDVVSYGGSRPAYAILFGDDGVLLLAYVPQADVHVLTIEEVIPVPPPEGLNPIQVVAIFAIVAVLVGLAAAFMLRRRPPS